VRHFWKAVCCCLPAALLPLPMRSTALRPLVVLAVVLPPAARAIVPNSIHELEHKLALALAPGWGVTVLVRARPIARRHSYRRPRGGPGINLESRVLPGSPPSPTAPKAEGGLQAGGVGRLYTVRGRIP
jgi:hypothetical protein